jgi:hypothetical protein
MHSARAEPFSTPETPDPGCIDGRRALVEIESDTIAMADRAAELSPAESSPSRSASFSHALESMEWSGR